MQRTYEVIIQATVRVKEEVVASNREEAEDIALGNYTLHGAYVTDEEVFDTVEITSYRDSATV